MLPEKIQRNLSTQEKKFLTAAIRASQFTTDGSVSANKVCGELGWSLDQVKIGSLLVNLVVKDLIYDVSDLGGDYVLKIGVPPRDYPTWPPRYDC